MKPLMEATKRVIYGGGCHLNNGEKIEAACCLAQCAGGEKEQQRKRKTDCTHGEIRIIIIKKMAVFMVFGCGYHI